MSELGGEGGRCWRIGASGVRPRLGQLSLLRDCSVLGPWVEHEDGSSARCMTSHGYRVLMIKHLGETPQLSAAPAAAWGLHVDDPNLAVGNRVQLAKSETAANLAAQRAAPQT